MNRLESTFARGHKVLVAYLCTGDPSVEESVDLALACARAGADVLELGVPFSDPTADGPVIALASQRAIAAGGGLSATLKAARVIRAAEPDLGIVLFGYYNPLFVRGDARVAQEAAEAGVDAFLVVDLPVEESAPLRAAATSRGVGFVPFLAPTSRADRISATKQATREGSVPFIYYVSLTGVTGSASLEAREAGTRAGQLRSEIGRPVVVGFGIDSREKARAASSQADGVVVGAAIVRAIAGAGTPRDRHRAVERLVHELRKGVDEAGLL